MKTFEGVNDYRALRSLIDELNREIERPKRENAELRKANDRY